MTRCRALHQVQAPDGSSALDRARARCIQHRQHVGPHVDEHGTTWDELTGHQIALLAQLRQTNGAYLRGAEVRVAKALARMRLVRITDEGDFRPGGRSDGERWLVEPIGCWVPYPCQAFLPAVAGPVQKVV